MSYKLAWLLDLDVVSHRPVWTSDGGRDFLHSVWCTACTVIEDAGSVDLCVPLTISVVRDVPEWTGLFEGESVSVNVAAHSVSVLCSNVAHCVHGDACIVTVEIGSSLALSVSCNVLMKSTKLSGHGVGHCHDYDAVGGAVSD